MAGRRQGEQRWRGSLMAVINDNRPEESWDTGATYIIPSHQSVHLRGLFSANQHTTATHTDTHTPDLLSGNVPPGRFSNNSLWLPVDDSQAGK